MAKVEHRVARKDYPESGIVKGDKYFYVQMKTGPRSSRIMRSKTPFRRSQLTNSDYLQQLYDWEDALAVLGAMDGAEDLATQIRELGEEQQAKHDNMPEGLQTGSAGEMLSERASACEAAADALDAVVAEWEEARDEHSSRETEFEQYTEARDKWVEAGGEESDEAEPDEVDDPGIFDEDEFLEQAQQVSVE